MRNITDEELEMRAEITVQQSGGLQAMHLAFYQVSIKYNYDRAQAAFQRYDQLVSDSDDAEELISAAQEAVSHIAALSRFFFPSRSGLKNYRKSLRFARADVLKRHFEIKKDSPLADRRMRNIREHFDERLDEYLLSNDGGMFFPSPMLDSHTIADDPLGKVFKLIDTDANCLVLLNEKFFIDPLRDELNRAFQMWKLR
ncbi:MULTISPECIES: hypothetical protein [unclassified Wenzhouxiangella]|uniref:hypothetical protein n=1 Tax=unclassified Wenzhouxiangella TaxID=2613841 RepID=UPI000E3BFFB9|nr:MULTISPECIES: hypothetical protein [unclassified Wenzhouxiangella]RFP68452.1 hypothetical protein DZK26_07130 [Wenzhouxiangella sp. 15190]